MDLILKNPYRVVGLLVGATARDQERQIKRLRKFIEADQEPEDDFSFPVLGNFKRKVSDIDHAVSRLNLNNDKVNSGLFWFFDGNTITDEPAFNELRNGRLKEATSIWGKLVIEKEISSKNASAFFNWSTLFINSAFSNSSLTEKHLEKGLQLKLRFLESNYFSLFLKKAADENFVMSKKGLQLSFLNAISSQIEISKKLTLSKLIDILGQMEFSAKEEFLRDYSQKPIAEIEKKIDETKINRKSSATKALVSGEELYYEVSSQLGQLKRILGSNDLKYKAISDKASSEILQCGIDYFKHYKDTTTDPGEKTMAVFRMANQLAIGNVAKQRCQENTRNLQEWIDEKPEREKQEKILVDFKILTNLIDSYENKPETIANAKQYLASAKPYLLKIKTALGSNDEVYIGLSTRVASDAISMLVGEINNLQSKLSAAFSNDMKRSIIISLKQKVDEAWLVTGTIGLMDLRSDFKSRYNTNKNSLLSLKVDLAGINTNPIPTSSSYSSSSNSTKTSTSSSSGCYIATMAYGDYDHPQVLKLRRFRDEVLDKSYFGKLFIKYYYLISPKLVSRLKGQPSVNATIQKILNQIIKLIN
jgi:hypothetical protein